jgi:hypothetical protein
MRATKVFGCTLLGCLGFPVAAALVLGAIVVIDKIAEQPADPAFEASDQVIPAGEGSSGIRAELGNVEASLSGLETPMLRAAGVLRLDVSAAELRIEPIPAGEAIRVEADYDRGGFELAKRLVEGADGWEYEVDFGPRSWLGSFSRENVDNRITIGIPENVPLRIEGRVRLAENDMELGGLHLLALDLEAGIGEHSIGFSRPTPRPVEWIVVDGSIGELELFGLGNASPLLVRVSSSVGEVHLGLDGDWRNDSEVEVDLGIGELNVERPRTARVESRGVRMMIGESSIGRDRAQEDDDSLPLIVLTTGSTIGEVRVE